MNEITGASGPPLLAARDLCRHYRSGTGVIRAVEQVNLRVQAGEFLALVGASGSGKSTLLNLLAGLDTPTAGRVEFAGTALGDMNRKQRARYRAREVGMVFQSFNLLSHLSALRNVELALYFGDTPPRARRALAVAALSRVGLADRLTHRPADLSGGEQQRVALARALVKEPRLLFADEPTGNLDHDNAEQLGAGLTELHRAGLTVILVTHDLGLARQRAQRTVRMRYGRLEADSGENPGAEPAP